MVLDNGVSIMLVEDDDADAEFIMRSLQKSEIAIKVFLARDGQEAIDHISSVTQHASAAEWPRLILLDLHLPRVNGFDVLRYLKTSEQLKSIPIVVFSSSSEKEDIERCYLLGANSYIQKPIVFQKFDKIIRDVALYWLMTNLRTSSPSAHYDVEPMQK